MSILASANHHTLRFRILGAMLCALMLTAGASHAQRYVVTDLGALGDFETFANDISTRTEVVGTSNVTTTSGSPRHGFRWFGGVMEDLGTLPFGNTSRARGLNDRGWIVGSSDAAGGPSQPVYMVYGYTDWIQVPHPGVAGTAADVSDTGYIVGQFYDSASPLFGDTHAFIWHPRAGLTDLSAVDGAIESLAWAVNNKPQVAGWSFLPADPSCTGPFTSSVPTLWQRNPWSGDWEAIALPTNDDCYGNAYGINEAGVLVGSTRAFAATTNTKPALWRKSHGWWFLEHLALPPGDRGAAYDINVSEQVVGTINDRAHLWECGEAINLNDEIPIDSGWVLRRANAINDRGDIVGYGWHNGGPIRGFLLRSHHVIPPCDE